MTIIPLFYIGFVFIMILNLFQKKKVISLSWAIGSGIILGGIWTIVSFLAFLAPHGNSLSVPFLIKFVALPAFIFGWSNDSPLFLYIPGPLLGVFISIFVRYSVNKIAL